MGLRAFTAAAFALLAAVPAPASMLYKSVGPNGVIRFSDTPPDKGQIVAQVPLPDSSAPAATNAGAPVIDASPELDAAVRRAGDQLDLAEHALAMARRPVWSEPDMLRVGSPHLTSADRDRIAFYEGGVRRARRGVADAMRRKLKAEAPMIAMAASTGWAPANPADARAANDWVPIRPAVRP